MSLSHKRVRSYNKQPLKKWEPDLIFVDIEMPVIPSCIYMLKFLRVAKKPVTVQLNRAHAFIYFTTPNQLPDCCKV